MNARRFLVFLALCGALCIGVCASPSDGDGDTTAPADTAPDSPSVVLPDTLFDGLIDAVLSLMHQDDSQGELVDVRAFAVPFEAVDGGIAPAYDLDNGTTTEPAGTLKSILVKLIGPYNPVVVEYRYLNNNASNYSYVREIQPDYTWWGAAGLFCLLIFCTFRLGGVFLRKT